MRVCKKMMLSYGGFQELVSLAISDTKQDLQHCALESLLVLAINSQKVPSIRRPNSFTLDNHVTFERSGNSRLMIVYINNYCMYALIDLYIFVTYQIM